MKIRNKTTGQVFEVVKGTLYPAFFEEVKDDDIKVGEPTVEFEIETNETDTKDQVVETETKKSSRFGKKKNTAKKQVKGAKNGRKSKAK